ncbi:MAG: adenosine kinase [Bacteroidales bacterium]|nr:adenosine kinase [Bacteroidales bacterium]OPZ96500.1 MAG: putative sugar kinase YdjH [Bacteroidetes bacterium ADurb.Bin416]
MYKILGMGNALTDVLVQLTSEDLLNELGLPKGSMQLIDEATFLRLQQRLVGMPLQWVCGGSAANTITGVSRMGVRTGFIGKVHNDPVGLNYKKDIEQHGVTPFMLEGEQPSGQAIVFITPDGERTFATYLGAASALEAKDLNPAHFYGFDLFYIEGYLVQNHTLMTTAIRMAREAGLLVALDLASYNVVEGNRTFLQDLVEGHIDIVFANEEEAKALTGLEPEAALAWLGDRVDIAVVKLGAKGAMARKGLELATQPAVSARCVDTTGAGDLFAAGFLYGLAMDKSLNECVYFGTVAAGKVIESIGPKIDKAGWDSVMATFYA